MSGDSDLAEDLLSGAGEIAAFIGPSFTERKVYHLHTTKALPTFQLPNSRILYARKSELRNAFTINRT
jgi:hypothetical protein